MLEKIKYVNHLNKTVVFGENGILVNKNDLRDFAWTYDSQFSKITSFTKKIASKKLPYLIYGGPSVANDIFETLEQDVLAGKPGTLYIGNYYIKGYFYGSKKASYLSGIIKGTLSFVTDQSAWIKAVNFNFRLYDKALQNGLGYSYDYPFDYTPSVNVQGLHNTSFVPCNFIITIYGPVNEPSLLISGHKYQVHTNLGNNEYLTINSYDKTIEKATAAGTKVNVFANRDLDSYIFEKIPTGENKVIPSADINYDIVLLMERSEPEWT